MIDIPSPGIEQFYVSAIDGTKKYLVAGPYTTHAAALGRVDAVRKLADKRDPRAAFMAWGTAGTNQPRKTPLGTF